MLGTIFYFILEVLLVKCFIFLIDFIVSVYKQRDYLLTYLLLTKDNDRGGQNLRFILIS